MSSELYKIFPVKLREKLLGIDFMGEGYTELRFRCNGPVTLLRGREESFLHSHGGLTRELENAYFVSVNEIREMMEQPEEYIDSRKYFSWEQFFTTALIEATKGMYLHYNKSSLNKNYLSDKCKKMIVKEIKGLEL